MTHRIKGAKNTKEENRIFNKGKRKKKGVHATTRGGLRSLKRGEEIVYGGAAFHIVKKKARKC